MDVSIIIVNYNTKELTRNCLRSVFDQTKDVDFEVIVSDNGSTDGSIEMIRAEFPQAILIENNANLGFGAANNRGLKIARGKYVFYLNSDTVLLNNAVKLFFDYWESSPEKDQIGALGAWLVHGDTYPAHSYGNFPTKKTIYMTFLRALLSSVVGQFAHIFKKNMKNKKRDNLSFSTIEVNGYITGADLFLKNNQKAFFDERFFMYFEETDLQLNNFYKEGFKLLIIEAPHIIHFEGGSDNFKKKKYDFRKKSAVYYWISCIEYCDKNLNANIFILKKLLSFFGIKK